MASLVKLTNLLAPLKSRNNGVLYNVIRTKVLTNQDWKPGPYPKTEAERRAAAEKYGIPYEEYEPYPDDGWGHGDYPKLPMEGMALRDPHYPWDWPEERRNFGETLHVQRNILGEDRTDFGEIPVVPYRTVTLTMILVFGSFFVVHYALKPYPCFRPVLEKQMPFDKDRKPHYTFEPAH